MSSQTLYLLTSSIPIAPRPAHACGEPDAAPPAVNITSPAVG